MEEEAADDSHDVSLEQTVLRLAEEAGKAEGSEGQRIVQKDLRGMHHIGAGDELENAVGKGGDDAHLRAVPVADEADDQHGKEGDGAAVRKAGQFDDDGDLGREGDGDAGEDDLSDGDGTFVHKKTSLVFCTQREIWKSCVQIQKLLLPPVRAWKKQLRRKEISFCPTCPFVV